MNKTIQPNFQTPEAAAHGLTSKLQKKGYALQALHVYRDADKNPLYWRIRLKHPETQEKWIRPMHKTQDNQYLLKEPKFNAGKPIYHLPDVIKHSEKTVWIVEGEQCADTLRKRRILTTTSGGESSVAVTDWSPLKNRKIIIWPDNDDAGLTFAKKLTEHLKRLQCDIRWIDVEKLGLPEKGDCVDWLNDHPDATRERIETLATIEPAISVITTQPNTAYSTFRITDKGIYHDAPDREPLLICSRLEIKALVRDTDSENWGRLLYFRDADNQEHTWSMPMQMLKGNGEELRSELLRMGLEISSKSNARNLLIEYITSSKPAQRALCVTRTGWHKQVFAFPNRTVGESDVSILYQAEYINRDYTQQGELVDWQENIAKYCCGNSRLIFAVSTAFASMLLYPSNSESGGIHFVGESSTGKTTALRVAASVFGAPEYLNRWRATTNGLEALAASRSDTLLILDELAQVDPNEAGVIAYMLANGSGKTRAVKSGGLKSKVEWRLLFLSAGEIGLSQHMREGGKTAKAGQEVRLVEIPVDTGWGLGIFENIHDSQSAADFSKKLNNACTKNYGVAAQSFLEKITDKDEFNSLNKKIQRMTQLFISENLPYGASGQAARVCERFALIAVAGEIASLHGITGWPQNIAYEAATACYQAWIIQRGGAGNQEKIALLKQVQAFFEAHGASRFQSVDDNAESRTFNRVGYRKLKDPANTDEEYEYFVLPEMFKNEMCKGFDVKNAGKYLVEAGMLMPDNNGKPQSVKRLPGLGPKRFYHFIKTDPSV